MSSIDTSGLFNKSIANVFPVNRELDNFFRYSLFWCVGSTFVFSRCSCNFFMFSTLVLNILYFSSSISPTFLPISVSLKSALSCLKRRRNSARLVNSLYGSVIPLFIKSSINTPMYASFLFRISGSLFSRESDAFIPAIKPCAAASSYPLVPFICPAL